MTRTLTPALRHWLLLAIAAIDQITDTAIAPLFDRLAESIWMDTSP